MMASMLARGASRLSRHHRTGWISSFGGFSTHRGFSTGEDRGPSTGDGTIPDGGCEPTFKGAYCESVAVELGTERTPVNVGFETGRVARLTNGAIIASMGDSRVICAAVCSRDEDPDAGFFPLQVDYRERQSAYGKIPPTFTRREGPPKDREVLAMRVVDRAIRPLFPKSFSRETSVQAIVLSTDQSQDPAVLAVNGASAALSVSSIPWNGPVGAVRVSVMGDGNEIVLNPSDKDVEASKLTLFYAGNEHRALMIEAQGGCADKGGVPESVVASALRAAHEAAKTLIEPQRKLQRAMGKTKLEPLEQTPEQAKLRSEVFDRANEKLRALYDEEIQCKQTRGKRMAELTDEIRDSMTEEGLEFTSNELGKAFMWVSSRVMRDMIFEDKKRIDGRGIRELRQLAAETNVMPVVHGSSIFERGNTQALATVAIGTLLNAQKLDAPVGPESRRMMLHYSFPSFSINETPRRGGLSRREIGHGALAEKSLAGIIPPARDWPFAVRINAETMESNGSSSMAAVCSGSLALMDAGVPIKEHVGAISVGLVMDEDESSGEVTRYELLSDIMGLEDVLGDMDFKIAGTRGGITGIQLDCKPAGIPLDILIEAMDIASVARSAVIDEMDRAIPKPRSGEAISENSSQFTTVRMNRSLIGRLIGPKGDNIRELERSTGAKVSIHEEGDVEEDDQCTLGVFAGNKAGLDAALQRIEMISWMPKEGDVVTTKVVKETTFGWFLRLPNEQDGLLHVSEYSHTKRVDPMKDEIYQIGEEVEVKIKEVGADGKIGLSVKALTPAPAGTEVARPRGTRARTKPTEGGGFERNEDGSLKRPLRRIKD